MKVIVCHVCKLKGLLEGRTIKDYENFASVAGWVKSARKGLFKYMCSSCKGDCG